MSMVCRQPCLPVIRHRAHLALVVLLLGAGREAVWLPEVGFATPV